MQFADVLHKTIQREVKAQAEENRNARLDKQFDKIKIFDGSNPAECHPWLEEVHALCSQTGRPFKEMLLLCAGQAVQDFILDMAPDATDEQIKNDLITGYSDLQGLGCKQAAYDNIAQRPEEPIRSYIVRYSRLFKLLNGTAPNEVRMRTTSMHFVNSLRSYLSSKVENRLLAMNEGNYSLGDTFAVALQCELKAIASERRHNKGSTITVNNVNTEDQGHSQLEDTQEIHIRNPSYKGENYDPNYDEIKEMMRGPRNHISRKAQAKYKLPAVPIDNAFLTSPADIPGPRKVDLQDADVKPTTRSAFDELCEKYPTIFSKGNEDIGRTQLIMMNIDTGDSPPVSSRPYMLALKHHQWVQNEIETLERAGVITKSMSPWASPIVVVPKKSQHGEPPKKRLCIDFRKINNLQQAVITEGKSKGCLSLVPLPKIDEMYAKLKGAKFFSTIDLRSGYYHIALGKDSRAKTAFVTPFGKYEFLQVPFGLAQAPAYFQHLMNQVLDNGSFAMTYLDDIIIFSETEEQHLDHIEEIFKRLEAADLKMKRSKCDFFKKHIHYLGHLISADGIRPLKDKLDSIRDMPAPSNSKEVKQFLGLVGYFRKFVPCFAALSRPLSKLTCKDKVFEWTKECEKAFATLKEKLCAQPILQYADTTKGYTLYTDASKYGWAGVLTQLHTTVIDNKAITTDHPIGYVSGLFRGSQINWAALTKEAYAIYMSVKKLSFYLTDAEVLLKSDHLPLKKFLQKNTLNNKVNNWAMELKAFNIKFQHVSGKTNILADTLSRLVDIDPDARLDPENAGWEFGYYVFETLLKLSSEEIVQICEVLSGTNVIIPDPDLQEPFTQILMSPLTNNQLQALQAQDEKCTSLIAMLRRGKLDPLVYSVNDNILYHRVIEGGQMFQAIYVPRMPPGLIESILKAAHDDSGHNGFPRTYSAIR